MQESHEGIDPAAGRRPQTAVGSHVMNPHVRRSLAAATALLAVGTLAACGSDDTTSEGYRGDFEQPGNGANIAPAEDQMLGDLIGTGCAPYLKAHPSGPASFEGMSQVAFATAASRNPQLSQLSKAVSGKLNPGVKFTYMLERGDYTVIAPVDAAFAKLPDDRLDEFRRDTKTLSRTLTYHLLGSQLAPSRLTGKVTTVEGSTIEVTGAGNDMRINGAGVVCGGVKTANATVYLVDQVLTPPEK
jgi:uncharacterized surface protein with fasciclin (FAS1) repeats